MLTIQEGEFPMPTLLRNRSIRTEKEFGLSQVYVQNDVHYQLTTATDSMYLKGNQFL